LITAVQDYARDINIDTEGIESAVRTVDPSDPEALQQALSGSLFHPEPSPAQRTALSRLETYLALVEGWVDVVTKQATSGHRPPVCTCASSHGRIRMSLALRATWTPRRATPSAPGPPSTAAARSPAPLPPCCGRVPQVVPARLDRPARRARTP